MTEKSLPEGGRAAYHAAVLPETRSQRELEQLFARGYEAYIVDDEERTEELLRDIEEFGIAAFDDRTRQRTQQEPIVDSPGTLAVLATLAGLCIIEHPRFESTRSEGRLSNIQLLSDIQTCYVNTLVGLLRQVGDVTLLQDIAEVVYAKAEGENGMHPGRVCTGIVEKPAFGTGRYVEIPMVAASRACVPEGGDAQDVILDDNCLYVPLADLDARYRRHATEAFHSLLRAQQRALSAEQEEWFLANEKRLSGRIERLFESGQYERIWAHWEPGEQKVSLLQRAVAESDAVTFGEWVGAASIFGALEAYRPGEDWEKRLHAEITSPRSLGNFLHSVREHRHVTVRAGNPRNEYQLTRGASGTEHLVVETLVDLFELPCLAALDERLQEQPPVRKDLYNLVRMAWWLPQYRESNVDTLVDDLKDLFSRWPWYDEQVSDYQIRYELRQTIDGEPPLPMNCDNEDMQRYCIGQDDCPYSIWGSVDFADEMYDQLDGTEDPVF